MKLSYLEIVTPNPDRIYTTYSELHGVNFSEPIAELGNARTTTMPDGSRIGVRGPLRPDETPVVRPYALVEDLDAALQTAKQAGAEIAVPAMPLPGQGTIGIYILDGIEHGLWQQD